MRRIPCSRGSLSIDHIRDSSVQCRPSPLVNEPFESVRSRTRTETSASVAPHQRVTSRQALHRDDGLRFAHHTTPDHWVEPGCDKRSSVKNTRLGVCTGTAEPSWQVCSKTWRSGSAVPRAHGRLRSARLAQREALGGSDQSAYAAATLSVSS